MRTSTWNHAKKSVGIASKFYSKIDVALDQLPAEQFVWCERSHIVNLDYVRWMNQDSFTLRDKDATELPISRRFKEKTKKAYIKYVEGSIWTK